jgi:hypothetical protein
MPGSRALRASQEKSVLSIASLAFTQSDGVNLRPSDLLASPFPHLCNRAVIFAFNLLRGKIELMTVDHSR